MTTFKMLKTQRAARTGDVHPVTFEAGKTYEIDDNLAGEFRTLGVVEESSDEPSRPLVDDAVSGTHEGWLDTDPAVLRHGELTAQEVVARDASPNPQTTAPAEQEEGKAEGHMDTPSADPVIDADATDGKPRKSK